MFGYVKAYNPEMKIVEFETYKAVYCALCKSLGKKYGIMARMTLSYDFTFMALLRLCNSKDFCGYDRKRCMFNPFKKCNCLKNQNDEIDYTAAVSIILFYYKLKDNIMDSGLLGRIMSYAILPWFSHYYKKAKKEFPNVAKAAEEMMKNQAKTEKSDTDSFDKSAEPTAQFLKLAFVRDNDSEFNKRVLSEMGYLAGKWIYLIDALDDLKGDIKSNNYNVIAKRFSLNKTSTDSEIKLAEEYAKAVINSYNSGICDAYLLLEKKRYGEIIGNVLYMGMPDVLNNLHNKKKGKSVLLERTEN